MHVINPKLSIVFVFVFKPESSANTGHMSAILSSSLAHSLFNCAQITVGIAQELVCIILISIRLVS